MNSTDFVIQQHSKFCSWFLEIVALWLQEMKDPIKDAMEDLCFLAHGLGWGLKDLNLSFSFGKYVIAIKIIYNK